MTYNKMMLTKIANMYYKQDLTQNQIAKLLGYSRVKVSRLLKKAREVGIVQISIDYSDLNTELENELANLYQINNAMIVNPSSEDITDSIAETAANYLNNTLSKNDIIAVGFGNTMSKTVKYAQGNFNQNLTFSPLIGGHGRTDFDLHSSSIATALANKYDAKANSILAPAFAKSSEEKTLYMNNPYVQDVLKESRKANKAFFSVGSFEKKDFTLAKTGYFTEDELETIIAEKAICDVCSLAFLNEDSQIILTSISDRSIGISIDEFKKIPNKICVAGTETKHKSIRVALKAGFIDTLITDYESAMFLLNK